MTDHADRIQPHMAVVGSDGTEFGKVDHLEGENSIKLTRDEDGNRHWIPVSWVAGIENECVRLDRTVTQAQQEWSDSSPEDL